MIFIISLTSLHVITCDMSITILLVTFQFLPQMQLGLASLVPLALLGSVLLPGPTEALMVCPEFPSCCLALSEDATHDSCDLLCPPCDDLAISYLLDDLQMIKRGRKKPKGGRRKGSGGRRKGGITGFPHGDPYVDVGATGGIVPDPLAFGGILR